MIIPVKSESGDYEIIIEKNILSNVAEIFDLERKIFCITDSGVPKEYSEAVKNASKDAFVFVFESGEQIKSFDNLKTILEKMSEFGMTRFDAVVAIGGGVVGDIAGFAAAIYERGIDFYNIPTTFLSQIDSSIGGKTAVNLAGIKNAVGVFKSPKKVLIDSSLLSTLSERQFINGFIEAVKMAVTFDGAFFSEIENMNPFENAEKIITKCILLKKSIVEKDEKESLLRKSLNFGHTIGHGIESLASGKLFHGECVALGMLCFSSDEVKERLISIFEKFKVGTKCTFAADEIIKRVSRDKKSQNGKITTVYVEKPGEYKFIPMSENEICERIKNII